MSIKKVAPLAASADLTASPIAVVTHDIAKMYSSNKLAAASNSSGSALGRKPIRSATPMTAALATRLRRREAATGPTSTDDPKVGSVRNRSITPVCMSLAIEIAVLAAPNPAQRTMTPGTT